MCKHVFLVAMAICLMVGFASAANMSDYCQAPPFLSTTASPNVLLLVDVSGSMDEPAYKDAAAYDSDRHYEGYFDPTKIYEQDNTNPSDPFYKEFSGVCPNKQCGGVLSCVRSDVNPGGCDPKGTFGCANNRWACCTEWTIPTDCGQQSGNYLNYLYMSRIDLLRWAMTGGKPASCDSNTIGVCDASSGAVQLACDAAGCTLLTSGGIKVKARWERITGDQGGLLYQFKGLPVMPRVGTMHFKAPWNSHTGEYEVDLQTAPFADFTGSSDYDALNPYKIAITALNYESPKGGTPIGPAMWAAYDYLSQSASRFGSLNPASIGNEWKDPMYQCIDADGNNKCEGNEITKVPCAKNFIILLADGLWNIGGQNWDSVNITHDIDTAYENPSADPVVPAYWMHKKGFTNAHSAVTTNVEAVYTLGLWLGGEGEDALKQVAMYGSFDRARDWPGNLTGYPQSTCTLYDSYDWFSAKGSLCSTSLPVSSLDWDEDKNDTPDTFFEADNASQIKKNIMDIIFDILRKASSGTAVSVLSSSEGSGANLMQALFYPIRSFGDTEVSWSSDLMNYWFYLDPYLTNMQIREDTVREGDAVVPAPNPPYTLLDLKQDYITSFFFDTDRNKTLAYRWQDTVGNGSILTATFKEKVPIEKSSAIWRAGFNLWWTDPGSRNIYTSVDGSSLVPFTEANYSTLDDYLEKTTSAVDAKTTINYVRGYDCVNTTTGAACTDCAAAGCAKVGRNRTVTSGVCSVKKSSCDSAADCPSGETCDQQTHVWKMGDIISSTPRIMGPGYLNTYNAPSPYGYSDQTYADFILSNQYKDRQLVFVGANDGMLHAFKLGKLLQKWTGKEWWQAGKQEGSTGAGGIGSESFAFIPKNTLPYLQYLQDEDYCHVYMVDGPTTLTDTTINAVVDTTLDSTKRCSQAEYWNCPKRTTLTSGDVDLAKTSWRTTLIGSMGIGGATCNAATPDVDRISTPISVAGNPVGWSSYFALDVTDQTNPQLLWEFSHADLGATNIGAGIVKVGGKEKRCTNDNTQTCSQASDCGASSPAPQCLATNGRWFAILASGATGPISSLEFKGRSDKTLKLFILDLQTGALLRTIDTSIANAFAGSISNNAIDLERTLLPSSSGTYQDDAVYIGYVQNTTNGGVLRLVINDDIDPANWTWSKVFDDGQIGPVTTSVVNLLDRQTGSLWLYFAEGRYFYKKDDLATQRKLFGVKDPCYDGTTNSFSATCMSDPFKLLNLSNLKDQTTTISTSLTTENGWFVSMATQGGLTGAERVISNPTPDALGAVYFLSFAPTADVCGYGGTTYLWALDYKTGGAVTYTLQGTALVQVSTGEIKELKLSDAFTQEGGRKSLGFKGIPPAGQGVMVITSPLPLKKFMHVQEQ